MKIAITGMSGNMGREVFKQTMELKSVEFVRVLLSGKKKNDKLAKKLKKEYANRIQIVRGTIASDINCKKLVDGVDYVVHLAGVIPPAADADFNASYRCNVLGTIALINAVKEAVPQPKYIHVSTVAVYGYRNEKHPYGRVGDPLFPSVYDNYSMHKLMGERYCLDAELENWVILRQTAMLHNNMLGDNISDGLMFHTALNAPLEWVSARDSGYLFRRIFERDSNGEVPQFWNKIYNVGAGEKGRATGYDTFNLGFALIGGTAEKFFKPNWFAARNSHGMWFSDGDELENLFHYQRDGVKEFWQEIGRHHKIYAAGKIVPAKLIHLFLFRRLLKHPNSPTQWIKEGDEERVTAMFGSLEAAKNLSSDWKDYKLLSKGDFGDFDVLKNVNSAVLLDHGYDESKPQEEWDITDLRSAAKFRGGEVIGDKTEGAYSKITWRCHEGHEFEASPYTVLRGGHWCPKCCQPAPWNFDRLSKYAPFFAQVWYDSHEKEENWRYALDDNHRPVLSKLGEDEV